MSNRHFGTKFPDNEAWLNALTKDVLDALHSQPNQGRDVRQVAAIVLGEPFSDYTSRRDHPSRSCRS